jgi:streptogramin lyase
MLFNCLRNWINTLERRTELRRTRRNWAAGRGVASRLFLERLEDRCLLSAQIFNYNPTLTDQYTVPTPNSGPNALTVGPDGNLWFTEANAANIGQINPATGQVNELQGIPTGGGPIIKGPNMDLWFARGAPFSANPEIVEMTMAGVTHPFQLPTGTDVGLLALGKDNNVWFTEYKYNKIGYITPGGQITEFNINFPAYDIISDNAGGFWIDSSGASGPGQINWIAHITPNNTETGISETDYSYAGHGVFRGLAFGSDGKLWLGEPGANFIYSYGNSKIDRVDPSTGQMTGSFLTPTRNSMPYGLVAGPDGAIWFAEQNASQISRITPDGIITEYPTPTPNSHVEPPILGPDGNIWFTEYGANQIGEVDLIPQQPESTPPVTQTAVAGISQSFNLGSFTDDSGETGPWNVDVNWDDGTTPDTTFIVSSTGNVPNQSHTYATQGTYTVTEKITNTTGQNDPSATVTFQVVVEPGPVVINTNTSGPGSLAQAINEINEYPSLTNNGTTQADITFAIPTTDPNYQNGQFTINTTDLPAITEPVFLDGFSQPGVPGVTPNASANTNPMGGTDPSDNAVRNIVLDGGTLTITGAKSTIRGLVIQNGGISITGSAASGNVIEGNYIDGGGINISSGGSNNTIGGTDASARNIIAGGGIGVFIGGGASNPSSGNVVEGNYIGIDSTGTAVAMGLGLYGVGLGDGNGNLIGGTTPSARNVIAGWRVAQVEMGFQGDIVTGAGTTVEGNYIGTDATGTKSFVSNPATSNTTGVSGWYNTVIADNLISGLGTGIRNVIGATIQGNKIGTDWTGTQPLPNGEGVFGQANNLIGGTTPGAGNIIAFNYGPAITAGLSDQIEGNALFNNAGPGVELFGTGDQIESNSIYSNAGPGVWVQSDPFGSADPFGAFSDGLSTGTSIQGNSIFGNGGLGIALGSIAVDVNGNPLTLQQVEDNLQTNPDLWDHDIPNNQVLLNDSLGHDGANNFQNFPVLNSAASSSTDTSITGTFSEAYEPNTTLTLDFYANPTPDPSGYGQGETWLGSATVTADANGNATFAADLPIGNLTGQWITATATVTDLNSSYNGDTSEFALDVQATPTPKQTFSQWLQAALPQNPGEPAAIVVQTGPGLTEDTVIGAVNSLSAPSVATTITLDLNGGTYDDTTVSPPQNATLIINGASGTNTFVGNSPALTVTGGNVIIQNVTFTTATDAPTILVTGGNLTLRDDVVEESTGYNDAAISITGGTVDLGTVSDPGGNTLNINGSGSFVQNATSNAVTAVGSTFVVNGNSLAPDSLSGIVFEDFNDDGQVDFGEQGIAGVAVALTGTDFLGNAVSMATTTDSDGAYIFANLQPGNYSITETQPAGYNQGIDTVGTAGGSLTATDRFLVSLAQNAIGLNGLNYNFGEQPQASGSVQKGQTAGIGFWNNKNGQALIKSFNGGSTSTQLAAWLAATLPHIFGIDAGSNALIHADGSYFTNSEVATRFQQDFVLKGVKLDAQLLATALSVYATNATLDNTGVAANYGFIVSGDGVGTASVNVGLNGAAFGVANNSVLTVLDLLKATDAQAIGDLLYNGDDTLRKEANNIYSTINERGGI